jgi:hypothetical protein
VIALVTPETTEAVGRALEHAGAVGLLHTVVAAASAQGAA